MNSTSKRIVNKNIIKITSKINVTPNRVKLVKLYLDRSNEYAKIEDYTNAIADFLKAIELKPALLISYNGVKLVKLYLDRGNEYAKKKDYTNAVADFLKAIELKPDVLDSYKNLIAVYEEQNNYSGIIDICNKYISIINDPIWCCEKLLEAYYNMKEYDKALLVSADLIVLNNSNHNYYIKRGMIYEKIDKRDEAIKAYSKAIELNETSEVYLSRGRLYEELNMIAEAEQDYNAMIQLENNEVSYQRRAEFYKRVGNDFKAKLDFEIVDKLKYIYTCCFCKKEYDRRINPPHYRSIPALDFIIHPVAIWGDAFVNNKYCTECFNKSLTFL